MPQPWKPRPSDSFAQAPEQAVFWYTILMFIRLTRFDGSPIWLNASFVVTIEPGRSGGSIVVPIGDGLDYEVRESPAVVLERLGNAPTPELIPVPISDSLSKLPVDVRPEGGLLPNAKQLAQEAREQAAKDAKAEKKSLEPKVSVEPAVFVGDAPSADADATGTVTKPRTRKTASTAKKTTRTRKTAAKKPILDLTEEQVGRLRKMAPGSVKKLLNTLFTQFKVADAEATLKALVAHDVVMTDERERVFWKPPVLPD